MREKITAKTVTKARGMALKGKCSVYVWDTELRGFGLRASPTAVSWIVQKRKGPRGAPSQRAAIGRFPPMELPEARELANIFIADAHKGVLPVDRKRKATQEIAQAPTLGETIRLFLKEQPDTRYWKENRARFENEMIATLGADRKIAEITKADVRQIIARKEAEYPGAARLLFALLRPFFKWCVAQDHIAASPMDHLDPPKPPKKRERKLSDDELRAFWIVTEQMPTWRPYYRLLLLTAQRREEVAGLRWSELNIEQAIWTIPSNRTKNGREHIVHLSPQAIAILSELPRNGPLVFSTTGSTSISGYSKAKARLDSLMPSVPEWRVHDLRRTAASGMAKLQFQPHVIERVLNHVSGAQSGLTGVYQQYEYFAERKACIDAWGNYVQSLVLIAQ